MFVYVFFIQDDRILSFWLTHVIPFLILAALKCSNSILVRGVLIDAESDDDGDCVAIPINYVRLHFQRERSKKLLRRPQQHDQRQFARQMAEKEVLSTLIEKSAGCRVETKIQSGMDARGAIV